MGDGDEENLPDAARRIIKLLDDVNRQLLDIRRWADRLARENDDDRSK